jgi:transcriptional regulator with XRE-family HTH domain
MNPVAAQFASNLRYCRKRAKLSQEDLGYSSGLHRTEIGLLERGDRVARIDTLIKVAGGLSVRPEELLDGIEWQPGSMQQGGFGVTLPEGED